MANSSKDTMTFQYLKEKATIRQKNNQINKFSYLIGFIHGTGYDYDEPVKNYFVFHDLQAFHRIIQEASNIGFDFC